MSDVYEPPPAPEHVRLVDIHGAEIEAIQVVYVGLHPDKATYHFEAWFPASAELPPHPNVRVGMMPGRTSLGFRMIP